MLGNGLLVQGLENNGNSITLSHKKSNNKSREQAELDTQDIDSPLMKIATSKHDLTTKLQTQNFDSEKSMEHNHRSPSYELKRKKKHSSKCALDKKDKAQQSHLATK